MDVLQARWFLQGRVGRKGEGRGRQVARRADNDSVHLPRGWRWMLCQRASFLKGREGGASTRVGLTMTASGGGGDGRAGVGCRAGRERREGQELDVGQGGKEGEGRCWMSNRAGRKGRAGVTEWERQTVVVGWRAALPCPPAHYPNIHTLPSPQPPSSFPATALFLPCNCPHPSLQPPSSFPASVRNCSLPSPRHPRPPSSFPASVRNCSLPSPRHPRPPSSFPASVRNRLPSFHGSALFLASSRPRHGHNHRCWTPASAATAPARRTPPSTPPAAPHLSTLRTPRPPQLHTWCFLRGASSRRSRSTTGMINASVLPDPVHASTATSCRFVDGGC
eukprot:364125-Chlamydomonas_euryale.AAC.6